MSTLGAKNANQEGGLPLESITSPGDSESFTVGPDDRILITGAAGFIGSRVLASLLDRGFRNLVCFVRPSSELSQDRSDRQVPAARGANRGDKRQSAVPGGLRGGEPRM